MDERSAAEQEIVDQGVLFVYQDHRRLLSRLVGGQPAPPATQHDLRSGPLGTELAHLTLIARGEVKEPWSRVATRVDGVLQLLFWPAGADDYTVPRSFWDTELGKMLAAAKFRSVDQADLMTVGEAATVLNVPRQRIYRWLDERVLNYVRDDQTGRTFVFRSDVQRLLDAGNSG